MIPPLILWAPDIGILNVGHVIGSRPGGLLVWTPVYDAKTGGLRPGGRFVVVPKHQVVEVQPTDRHAVTATGGESTS